MSLRTACLVPLFCGALACGVMRTSFAAPHAVIDGRHRELLVGHCQRCHGRDTQESGFRVDDLPLEIDSVGKAERWQKVLDVLNAGAMPPEKEPRIAAAAKTELLDELAEAMVTARGSLADQGGVIAMRRLNRREYRNTIRDLLGVEVAASELPADTSPLAFDTVGAGLFMTASQFEQYEGIAREALGLAFARWAAAGKKMSWHYEAESTLPKYVASHEEFVDRLRQCERWFAALEAARSSPANAAVLAELGSKGSSARQVMHLWERFAGMPRPEAFGFTSGPSFNPGAIARTVDERRFVAYEEHYLSLPALDTGAYLTMPMGAANANNRLQFEIPSNWPPGECVVRIRCASSAAVPESRRYLEFANWSMTGPLPARRVHQVTATLADPEVFEIPFTINAGGSDRMSRRIYLFRERGAGEDRVVSGLIREGLKNGGIGPEPAIWVDWIDVERVQDSLDAAPAGIRSLRGVPLVESADSARDSIDAALLREALRGFCREAFRGLPVRDESLARLLAIYRARRSLGAGHLEALKEMLAAVLSSPRFLYRAEPGPSDSRRDLDGLELATRLSYFLWGRPPDAELRDLGANGRLLEPAVLASQTDRLLDDRRAVGFVEPFLAQWLTMERLDFFQVDPEQYPRFDRAMKEAARREVYETFASLLRTDGSLRGLLAADQVVVNGLLAGYYGLTGVSGDDFRRVTLPVGSPRGGLLGMAAIHVMGSNGEQTNPVERGAWVLRKVLNDPPPPAPPNVPQLARLAGQPLTVRERMLAHQEEPQCASCHRKIDPIGFGLENFDAVGQWRTTDMVMPVDVGGKKLGHLRKTWTIDPSGRLHGGPAFADFFELRRIIAARPADFARGFTAALIEYSLGRPCGFSDGPLIDSVVNQAAARDLGVRSFIHALVQSEPFRRK